MKKIHVKNLISKIRAGVGFIVIAALLSQLFNVAQYIYTRQTIKSQTTEHILRNMHEVQRVANEKTKVETAVQNAMGDVLINLTNPDMFYGVVSRLVLRNDIIVGSSIAMIPGFFPQKDKLYAPFAYSESADGKGQPLTMLLPYDYTNQEWYLNTLEADSAMWTEPYTDTGGSGMIVKSFCQPIHNQRGQVIGVLRADIFYEDLIIEDDRLYGDIDKVNFVGFGLQLMAFLLIVIIIIRYIGKLHQINNLITEQNLMGKELQIASSIQSAMLPQVTDEENKRHHLEVRECLIPAPDVSADFYDYFYIGSKMIFCIGDVPGSSVRAALMMSVTQSVFRTVATIQIKNGLPLSPASLVSAMNHSICAFDRNEMFATLFVGMIDTERGSMTYCNAGNPSPYVISQRSIRALDPEPNIPIGVVDDYEYVQQELYLADDFTLFLYNDGLYETENGQHVPYGLKRMATRLESCAEAGDNLETIISKLSKAIETHRGSAPQTDDVLMLAISSLKNRKEGTS